jgi:Kef-type K+ transport system membrane component KefB
VPLVLGATGQTDVVRFFTLLAVMLVVAKLAAAAFERLGQPAVLGELVAGILLGASALRVFPTGSGDALTPVFHLLAEVGVVVLLFEIGLATDLRALLRVGPAATAVAAVGVALPFVLGFLYWRSGWHAVEPTAVDPTTTAVVVGATLTATSVGITTRVLSDLHVLESLEARLVLGAAVIDDVLGLVILGVVTTLATGAAFTLPGALRTLAVAVAFLVATLWIGRRVAPRIFALVDQLRVRGALLVAAFAALLVICALAERAGTAFVIGAFATGLILAETRQVDLIAAQIRPVADLFTPLFFVSVGAALDLGAWNPLVAENRPTLVIAGVLLVIALIGKFASGFAVPWRRFNRATVGVGMAPRGEVGLIFAQMGLAAGILSTRLFGVMLFVVVATTLVTPPLLQWTLRRGVSSGDSPAT